MMAQEIEQKPDFSPITPLDESEKNDLIRLEGVVRLTFYRAGKALGEIRERKLYREAATKFEEYCRIRFGHSRQKANYLIGGATVFENLTTNCCQNEPNIVLPVSESQCRPLVGLPPQQQVEVWQAAVEKAEGKVPSASKVNEVLEELKRKLRGRSNLPFPYSEGIIVEVVARGVPELKPVKGHWGYVKEIHSHICATLRSWNGEYLVRPEDIKEIVFAPDDREKVIELCDRLYRLAGMELERSSRVFLASLGQAAKIGLSPLEENLVSTIEKSVNSEKLDKEPALLNTNDG
ncbi:MAG: hypothetical protein N5P05_004298 (plasmid) [Chroococcopsis gigantea SAG 12.99]|jgi:hypothetical protein|nr:hypothetical protein [Chroococcopsis gigantea SAG 12.99]